MSKKDELIASMRHDLEEVIDERDRLHADLALTRRERDLWLAVAKDLQGGQDATPERYVWRDVWRATPKDKYHVTYINAPGSPGGWGRKRD